MTIPMYMHLELQTQLTQLKGEMDTYTRHKKIAKDTEYFYHTINNLGSINIYKYYVETA